MPCLSPQTINNNTFSCGKCTYCRGRYIQQWVFRLQRELHYWKGNAVFVTLTIDYEHMILNKGKMTLNVKQYQLFLKRLRKSLKRPIKYVICGEYGSKTKRPHYHAILFNVTKDDYNEIYKAWQNGHVHVGDVNAKTIAYTFKYQQKSLFEKYDWRQLPPFVKMSKGLGLSFIMDENGKLRQWFVNKLEAMHNMPYLNLGNYRMGIPRYFIKKSGYDPSVWREKVCDSVTAKYPIPTQPEKLEKFKQRIDAQRRGDLEKQKRQAKYAQSKDKV